MEDKADYFIAKHRLESIKYSLKGLNDSDRGVRIGAMNRIAKSISEIAKHYPMAFEKDVFPMGDPKIYLNVSDIARVLRIIPRNQPDIDTISHHHIKKVRIKYIHWYKNERCSISKVQRMLEEGLQKTLPDPLLIPIWLQNDHHSLPKGCLDLDNKTEETMSIDSPGRFFYIKQRNPKNSSISNSIQVPHVFTPLLNSRFSRTPDKSRVNLNNQAKRHSLFAEISKNEELKQKPFRISLVRGKSNGRTPRTPTANKNRSFSVKLRKSIGDVRGRADLNEWPDEKSIGLNQYDKYIKLIKDIKTEQIHGNESTKFSFEVSKLEKVRDLLSSSCMG